MKAAVDTATGSGAPTAETEEPRERHPLLVWAWGLVRLDFVGVAFGTLFFCLSLTPSLLPRDWLFQGLIGGINAAIGYGIGVVIGTLLWRMLLRRRDWWPPRPRVLYGLKAAIVAGSVTASVLMVIPAAAWQRQVSELMGIEGPSTLHYMRTLLIAVLAGGALVGVARVILDAIKTLARYLIRRWHVNDEVALFIGTAIVAVLIITLVNGVLIRGFIAGASRVFQPQNVSTRPGIVQPTQSERSGSPKSFADWDSLGYQGRIFVSTGPHANELTELNGHPAKEPIRIYAGLATADTDEARVNVILSELQRTHAFDRKLLVIVPTTGTGWVDPIAARSIESMHNGDTAIVALQYSYLPSWISFLADKQRSMESGKQLIDAVHGRWAAQPPDRRPKLALYGESLGSMAGQGAFNYLPDIERMGFSSVLWVGPPNASPLWHALTVRRDPGTPEGEPRYDGGRTVRFSQGDDVAAVAAAPWQGTRVLFLQHASDPIVWWSPDLVFDRPDWLIAPAARDRSPLMRWYPIVTFWQVGFDMTNASGVPAGHGHNYGNTVLDGWVAVAPPDGWTPEDTDRVRRTLEKVEAAGGPRILMAGNRIRKLQALGLAGGLVAWSAGPARRFPLAQALLAAALVAITKAPLGFRPPALWAGLRVGSVAASVVTVAVAAGTAIPRVHAAMADRTPPASPATWLALRIPVGTVWSEEAAYRGALATLAADGFGPRAGRLVQATAFGLSHVPDARATGESVVGTVLVTGAAGWVFGRLAGLSGSLLAPMLAHLAINEAGAVAALRVQSRKGDIHGEH